MLYFDFAATAPVYKELNKVIGEYNSDNFFNPSAPYSAAASRAVEAARSTLAGYLRVPDKGIVFTSGATEANNQALVRGVSNRKDANVVATAGEHASVYRTLEALAQRGVEVRIAPLKKDGRVDEERLVDSVDKNTVLVSVIHVSNETGAVNDIARIAKAVKQKNAAVLFHADGVQALGRRRADLSEVDFYAVSAHKIHGPKGVGALCVSKKTNLSPLLYGGGQESGLRSGTENVSGIVAFGAALTRYAAEYDADILETFKRCAVARLSAELADFAVNVSDASPHILSARIDGVRAETLMHCLANKEIYIGLGSACSSHASQNRTLDAVGLTKKQAESSFRLSFDAALRPNDVETLCRELTESALRLGAKSKGRMSL